MLHFPRLKPRAATLESRRNELRLYWNAYLCKLKLQHGRDVACNVSPTASARVIIADNVHHCRPWLPTAKPHPAS